MNLIRCSELCAHQRDGYCTLDKATSITSAENICCYFSPGIDISPQNKV